MIVEALGLDGFSMVAVKPIPINCGSIVLV